MPSKKYVSKTQLVNPKTGEIIEAVIFGEPYWKSDKGFIKVFSVGLKELVKSDEIVGKAGRLLFWILAEKLDWNSYEFHMTEKEAMKELHISRATYYRWLETLIKKGILEKVATNIFRLKPYLAVRGNTEKAKITAEAKELEGVDF